MQLINCELVVETLTHEAPWCGSHGADGDYLGMGLIYYGIAYILRAKLAVCLGSGGGFVPRLMRQAQRDLGIADDARTILVDANRPEAGRVCLPGCHPYPFSVKPMETWKFLCRRARGRYKQYLHRNV